MWGVNNEQTVQIPAHRKKKLRSVSCVSNHVSNDSTSVLQLKAPLVPQSAQFEVVPILPVEIRQPASLDDVQVAKCGGL